jgi:hypothetical protein
MIRPSLAKSRLARAVQSGAPSERVAELRSAYYHARAHEYLSGLIAQHRLTAQQRRELAGLLQDGGADAAA